MTDGNGNKGDFSFAKRALGGLGGNKKKPAEEPSAASSSSSKKSASPASGEDLLEKLVGAMKAGGAGASKVEPPGYGYLLEVRDAPGKTIGPRSMDEPVRALQKALRRAKVAVGETGFYDEATQEAVRRFQQSHGVQATGIFDAATFEALHKELGLADEENAASGSSTVVAAASLGSKKSERQPLPVTGNAFLDGIAPGAVKGMHETGFPASVSIAMAVIESDWGQRLIAKDYHNIFSIKGTGPAGSVPMNEETGRPGGSTMFRVYNDDSEAVLDHARLFAGSERYNVVMGHKAHPDNFARALVPIYSEDPTYGSLLIRIMKQFDLYRFDKVQKPATVDDDE